MTTNHQNFGRRQSSGTRHRRLGPFALGIVLTFAGIAQVVGLGPLGSIAAAATPTATIAAASNLANNSVTLNGTVNPGGTSATITFCYSTSSITTSSGSGGKCSVSSGTIGYATAGQSPSSSSSAIAVSAGVTGLAAGTKYYYAVGVSQTAGTTYWSSASSVTTMTGAPFVCTPDFYQVNSSYTWRYNPVTGLFGKLNTTAQSASLNALGYNALNNYLYAVNGSTLYEVGNDGNETSVGTATGIQSTGGDFLPGTNFLLTNSSSGALSLTDVMSPTLATATIGTTSGSVSFDAYDDTMTLQGSNYVGYGLAGTGTNKATLYKIVIPTSAVGANSASWGSSIANAATVTSDTSITLTGSAGSGNPPTSTGSDSYGASYSDAGGDAFFYDNTTFEVFEASSSQLSAAGAMSLPWKTTATGLSSGANDGASCPDATNPFAPPTPVNDTYTVVSGGTLTVNSAGTSVMANDQIVAGSADHLGTVTLEPGAGQVAKTFSTSTTTANGSGFTGSSTSITVASTSGMASSGTLSIPASGGSLEFAYTGTTGTAFTGLTLVSGTASWTITTGATVTAPTVGSGTLVGVNGTLDVTDAVQGYFTFAPAAGFIGAETFTYNLDETNPNLGNSTTSATVTINVVHQQVIAWSTPTTFSTTDTSATPNPATDLGNAPITYSVVSTSTNSAGCSVDPSTGVITYAVAGVCTVEATAAATSTYNSASTQLTFTITSATIPTVAWTPAPTTLTTSQSGTTITNAATTSSTGAITYAVAGTGDTAGCSISSATWPFTLSFTGAGVCDITATVAANGSYATNSVTVPFTVVANPTLTWSPTTTYDVTQSGVTLASASTNSDGSVTYAVSGTGDTSGCNLASPSAPVVLTFTTPGVCAITVSTTATTSFAAASVTHDFTITGPPTATTDAADSISVSAATLHGTVSANGSATDVTFCYSVSATTNGSGALTSCLGSGPNAATTGATQASNASDTGATYAVSGLTSGDTYYFQVIASSTSGTAYGTVLSFTTGSLLTQSVEFAQPADAAWNDGPVAMGATATSELPVSYSSSTTGVCTVDGSGNVSFVTPGTCTITASQDGDGLYSAATPVERSFQVLMTDQLILFPQPPSLAVGAGPLAMGATATSDLPVSYNSSTTGVCTVDGSGDVTPVTPGTCTVVAGQAGNDFYNPATDVSRSFQVTAASQSIDFSQPTDVAWNEGPVAMGATASSELPVSYNSSTTGVCTVDGSGDVTFVTPGTCTITASQDGNATYSAATPVERSFQVLTTDQLITFPQPPSLAVDAGPLAMGATANSDLPVSYISSTTDVCTVDGSGNVTPATPGTCTIVASQSGNDFYNPATDASQSFLVTALPQNITLATPPTTIWNSGPLNLGATASSSLPVSYSSQTPSVCAVDSSGDVTMVGLGTCTITASQSGDSDYGAATDVVVSFQITKSVTSPTSGTPTTAPGTAMSVNPDGSTSTLTVSDTGSGSIAISGSAGLTMTLAGATPGAAFTSPSGVLNFHPGSPAVTTGTGFLAGSTVQVWLVPGDVFLGTATVDGSGDFTYDFNLPSNLAAGEYTVQVTGLGSDQEVHALDAGVAITVATVTTTPTTDPVTSTTVPTTGATPTTTPAASQEAATPAVAATSTTAQLASTGFDPDGLLLVALLLLAIGSALVIRRRQGNVG